jgi:Tol biopolymer transport system component
MAKLSLWLLVAVTVVHVAVISLALLIGADVPSKEIAYTTRRNDVLVLMDVSRSLSVDQRFDQMISTLDWMPDGETLLITAEKDYRLTLYQWREGRFFEARKLNTNQKSILWSPDRTKIAYSLRNEFALNPNYDLYISNADGKNVILVANTPQHESPDTWSSDGTKLVYRSDYPDSISEEEDISVFDLSLGQSQYLDEGINSSIWSPDGKYLFYQQQTYLRFDFIKYILVYNLTAQSSTLFRVESIRGSMSYPKFSPDGDKILFVSDQQLYTSTADGKMPQLIAHSANSPYYPNWSLDERSIVYFTGGWEKRDLYYVPNVDNPQSQLLYEDVGYVIPAWRPTG